VYDAQKPTEQTTTTDKSQTRLTGEEQLTFHWPLQCISKIISTRGRLQCHQFQLLTNNKLTFCKYFFLWPFVFLFLILDYGSLLDIIYGIIDFLLFIVIFYLNLFTFASMIYEYS
jgi:hypothetical protein